MQAAGDVRQEQIGCAQQRYILGTTPDGCESHEGDEDFVGLGQAQIKRATDLGDANIAQATARGEAVKSWRLGVDGAESGFASKERLAANARRNFVLGAERDYAIAVASARRDEVKEEQDANVTLTDMEGTAAIGAARERARAEVTYQYATAQQQAQRLHSVNPVPGTQAYFDAIRADAQVQWIYGLSDAAFPPGYDGYYVTHAAAEAYTQAYVQPYLLAVAWRTRQAGRAAADYQFAVDTAQLQASRAAGDGLVEASYAGQALAYEAARNYAHAFNLAALEVKLAGMEKQYAIDVAEAEKKYQLAALIEWQSLADGGIGYAPWDSKAWEDRKEDLAWAEYDRIAGFWDADRSVAVPGIADAQRDFQKAESSSRKSYSQSLALAEKNRAVNLAAGPRAAVAGTPAETTHIQADFQLALDAAYATAEENYWLAETAASNAARLGKAVADASYWTAQEQASVWGAYTIDEALALPWTDYLLAQTQAHQAWWGSPGRDYLGLANDMADQYLQWVSDR